MKGDRAIELAIALMRVGVSRAGVTELLSSYEFDVIERQLQYLPFRKAKRPEAFIIEAIRHDYSPPKELYYAPTQTQPTSESDLDEDAKRYP